MSIASKYITIAIPFLAFVFYIIQRFYLRTSRQMRLLDIEYKAPLYSQLMETLSGLPTMRAFQWQDKFEKRFLRVLDDSQRPSYLLYCIQRWLNLAVDLVIAIMAIILITIAVKLLGKISPGYMGIALLNIMSFSATVKTLITSWVTLEISIGAVARIKSFTDDTESEDECSGLRMPPESWPSQGAIEIRDFTASYQ